MRTTSRTPNYGSVGTPVILYDISKTLHRQTTCATIAYNGPWLQPAAQPPYMHRIIYGMTSMYVSRRPEGLNLAPTLNPQREALAYFESYFFAKPPLYTPNNQHKYLLSYPHTTDSESTNGG